MLASSTAGLNSFRSCGTFTPFSKWHIFSLFSSFSFEPCICNTTSTTLTNVLRLYQPFSECSNTTDVCKRQCKFLNVHHIRLVLFTVREMQVFFKRLYSEGLLVCLFFSSFLQFFFSNFHS